MKQALAATEAALNKRQAAERVGVSHRTISRLIDAGQIRAFKVGSQVRILESDLDKYVARQLKAGL